jgi:hypothetical protein
VDEDVDPYISGEPHIYWHEQYKGGYDNIKRSEQPRFKKDKAYNKSGNAKGNAHTVANIHCTIKKGRFNFVMQSAMAAFFVHFKYPGQFVGIFIHIHTFLLASGAGSC